MTYNDLTLLGMITSLIQAALLYPQLIWSSSVTTTTLTLTITIVILSVVLSCQKKNITNFPESKSEGIVSSFLLKFIQNFKNLLKKGKYSTGHAFDDGTA